MDLKLKQLASKADNGNDQDSSIAQSKLTLLALQRGISKRTVNECDDWRMVANLIDTKGGEVEIEITPFSIKPINDRVVIERDEAADKSKGGITLPDSAKERPRRGTVRAVGPGAKNTKDGTRTPVACNVGDVVLFPPYAGVEVEVGSKTYLIVHESDVIGIVD